MGGPVPVSGLVSRLKLPLLLMLFILLPISVKCPDLEAHSPTFRAGGVRPGTEGINGLQSFAMYAHVTAYHNQPGDALNGGPRNFMGRPLRPGYSAAGPADLAGFLVEVPDFNPERRESEVSEELRRFIRKEGYSSFFVIDDIGRWITFLNRGKSTELEAEWSLAKLSEYSLSSGDPVVDIDIMIPEERLARSYTNRNCLVRLYVTDFSDVRWVNSSSSRWKGKKPIFDTLELHGHYMALLREGT